MKASSTASPEVRTDFTPPWLLRHAQLQSILATKSPQRRRWLKRDPRLEIHARALLLDAGDGVRLCGYHSAHSAQPARGLAVLIHGWEGSHESSYLYSMACTLYAAGYNVLRLNLRDHGGSHHLNRAFFHSARIDEVIGAIATMQTLDKTEPLLVIGFSLGGSFALRIGLHGPARGLQPQLAIGISPAINPRATLQAIDRGPALFRRHFAGRWRDTVHAKRAAWPDLDTSALLDSKRLLDITAAFAERHTEYGALDPYLAAYTLDAETLYAAPAPLAILTAADDPVIPVADFTAMRAQASLHSIRVTRHGGHCGFFENLALQSWAERHVLELLARAV